MGKAKIDQFSEEELRAMVAESHSMRELNAKLGYTATGSNNKTVQSRLDKYHISTEHFNTLAKEKTIRVPENTFIKDSTATQAVLRRLYLKGNYSEYKCAICGLPPFWNGKELTLTLDHINGENHDDRLENLRWVCPNCDRQLSTFAGKNLHQEKRNEDNILFTRLNYCIDCGKKISVGATRCIECQSKIRRIVDRPSAEELYNFLLENNGNFSYVASRFHVTDNAIRKWCKSYGLPFHSADYKTLKEQRDKDR